MRSGPTPGSPDSRQEDPLMIPAPFSLHSAACTIYVVVFCARSLFNDEVE